MCFWEYSMKRGGKRGWGGTVYSVPSLVVALFSGKHSSWFIPPFGSRLMGFIFSKVFFWKLTYVVLTSIHFDEPSQKFFCHPSHRLICLIHFRGMVTKQKVFSFLFFSNLIFFTFFFSFSRRCPLCVILDPCFTGYFFFFDSFWFCIQQVMMNWLWPTCHLVTELLWVFIF